MKKNKQENPFLNCKAVIGIDESYTNTGISLCIDKKVITVKSLITRTKNDMRLYVQNEISNLAHIANWDYNIHHTEMAVVFERVRLFSSSFISTQYMLSMSYLNGAIIMKAIEEEIPCYSIDTKCWKSHVVGSSKPQENKYGVDPKKFITLDYCMKNPELKKYVVEYEENERKQKKCYKAKDGKYVRFNDNLADAICISLSPWYAPAKSFKEEK